MPPTELPSFYLYSIGYSPNLLTLGTLIFGNYGRPERSSVTFPKLSDEESAQLEKAGEIISQTVNGCFTYSKNSKYGLGVSLADLANVDFEYATECSKVVDAKSAKRVVLRNPDQFFQRVLAEPSVIDKLKTWATAAKSAWIFYKATFRKPRVFCLTGYYAMSGVNARITDTGSFTTSVGISSTVTGLASGVPVGGQIGPFSNGQTLAANVSMPETNIWSARFHEVKLEYILMAATETVQLPQVIELKDDCTHPAGGLMAAKPAAEETCIVSDPNAIKRAQHAMAALVEADEVMEEEDADETYWRAFRTAERRLDA